MIQNHDDDLDNDHDDDHGDETAEVMELTDLVYSPWLNLC